ncbi:chorion peroxidase [Aplysia californica]|uniref:Chorion peroxidase n=1 Tax=Aplysia californica TaxID=6500 RepID=A0ABM1A4D2_APLCA|nr:chorion peroxidase [Aplysia californica]
MSSLARFTFSLSLAVALSFTFSAERAIDGCQRAISDISCDVSYPYRQADGSCNNIKQPTRGRTNSPFRRLLSPVYDQNDGNTPRLVSVAPGNPPLPSPRTVSTNVHPPGNALSDDATVMLMQWGQFLDHDITHTPQTSSPNKLCCSGLTNGSDFHPDVRSGGPCHPIMAPEDDPYFNTQNTRCISFTRSEGVLDDMSIRQQYSDITPFLDGSQIYGSSETHARSLRSFENGKLRAKIINGEEFLPKWEDDSQCFKLEPGDYCFLAGDVRVNVYPGLNALHTVFLRYHNLLCERLKAAHEDWTDEKLYQQARRIVGAILQKVSYSDYLKTLLGETVAKIYDLLPGDGDYAYNDIVDPTLSNAFSTAAYRFGHSSIPDDLQIGNETVPTGKLYLRPKFVLNGLDDVIKALSEGKQQRVDRTYSRGVTDQLFEPPKRPGKGFDLVALNIQRGRDHGLPPYNAFRRFCGLPAYARFSDLQSGQSEFSKVYASPDDIDLYSGGLSEKPVQGGRIGEVFTCILALQFRDLKFGDRFWYENQADPTTAFTPAQIAQVNSFSLAKVICDVTGISRIQPNLFLTPVGSNTRMRCSGYRDLNIEQDW